MGNKGAKLKSKELKSLVEKTKFSADEVKALYHQFRSIKADEEEKSATADLINREEFQKALGCKSSFFVDRVFLLFDENRDGFINFSEFACGIGILSPKGTFAMKVSFAFDVYDLNGDERIDKSELRKLLDAALTENSVPLSEAQVTELVETTFAQADTNKDGFIDRDEFRAMVNRHRAIIDHIELNVTDIIKEAKAAASSSEGSGAGAGAGAGSRGK